MIVLAATRLEERAARRELDHLGVRVVRSGIGQGGTFDDAVVSCGLAGGLRREVPSGTVLIPDQIGRRSGMRLACDPELVACLRDAARALGVNPLSAPLLTTSALVRGAERETFANFGYAAVDMESGAIEATRIAAVRVILDTPERELSDVWLHPLSIFLQPRALLELPWLARNAPRYARLGAQIIRKALTDGGIS